MPEEHPPKLPFDLLVALQNEAIAAGLIAIKERLDIIESTMARIEEESKKPSDQ
jgi:hypothetical protein